MFNMKEIGGNISRMRKAANLTQMELADRMGVSFQAVSNWERGQTMPDISRLPELSSALGVTVDEILGDKKAAQLVETLEKGDTPPKLTAPELEEVAPLLRPQQADRVAREAGLSMAELVAMAPFVSEEVLEEFARDFAESGGSLNELVGIAPFLEEEVLGEIAGRMLEQGGSISDLLAIAPMLDEDVLGEIARTVAESGGSIAELAGLAPFLDEDVLGEIAERLLERGGNVAEIVALAPFLDEQVVSRMAAAVIRTEGIAAAMPLLPFVDSRVLDDQFRSQKGFFFRKKPR